MIGCTVLDCTTCSTKIKAERLFTTARAFVPLSALLRLALMQCTASRVCPHALVIQRISFETLQTRLEAVVSGGELVLEYAVG